MKKLTAYIIFLFLALSIALVFSQIPQPQYTIVGGGTANLSATYFDITKNPVTITNVSGVNGAGGFTGTNANPILYFAGTSGASLALTNGNLVFSAASGSIDLIDPGNQSITPFNYSSGSALQLIDWANVPRFNALPLATGLLSPDTHSTFYISNGIANINTNLNVAGNLTANNVQNAANFAQSSNTIINGSLQIINPSNSTAGTFQLNMGGNGTTNADVFVLYNASTFSKFRVTTNANFHQTNAANGGTIDATNGSLGISGALWSWGGITNVGGNAALTNLIYKKGTVANNNVMTSDANGNITLAPVNGTGIVAQGTNGIQVLTNGSVYTVSFTGSGLGSQTPITQDVNVAGFQFTNANNIISTNTVQGTNINVQNLLSTSRLTVTNDATFNGLHTNNGAMYAKMGASSQSCMVIGGVYTNWIGPIAAVGPTETALITNNTSLFPSGLFQNNGDTVHIHYRVDPIGSGGTTNQMYLGGSGSPVFSALNATGNGTVMDVDWYVMQTNANTLYISYSENGSAFVTRSTNYAFGNGTNIQCGITVKNPIATSATNDFGFFQYQPAFH